MRDFDTDTIRAIAAFEEITKTEVRDCIRGEMLYFLVNSGKAGKAIGKGGAAIKTAERLLQRPIKIFEWSDDTVQFIKNMIPTAKKISINNSEAVVSVDSKSKGMVIGKEGSNIEVMRAFLERNSDVKSLRIV